MGKRGTVKWNCYTCMNTGYRRGLLCPGCDGRGYVLVTPRTGRATEEGADE